MDFDETKQLIELIAQKVANTDITELTVETSELKIAAKKDQQPVTVTVSDGAAPVGVAPIAAQVVSSPSAETSSEADDLLEAGDDLIPVTAPMVGTFYRAPDPESAPYVKEGDAVQVGQTLCIIEAMKLMNEIESEMDGRIVRILVEDGEPVEYGETLFLIQPQP